MKLQDVDGRHFLSGAPEAASPSTQPDQRRHLLYILPLQSDHGEAADAAECGPGMWGLATFLLVKVDIDLSKLYSSLTSPWPIWLSTTPE